MSSEANQTGTPEAVAKQAPTEQQESRPGKPKRFAPGQTVCNEKNEKGKLCNGHLKELNTQHPARAFLRGDDSLHRCQTCGALYTGPPMGHVRDASKQTRYVERDLAAILRAAGGTLPAYEYPTPTWRGQTKPNKLSSAKPAAQASAPDGETPEQKKARLVAEHKAKLAAGSATPAAPGAPTANAANAANAEAAAPTTPADSSASADAHRPAAEAQAATGQASAAPLSPTAATASPAAGAETAADLAPEASTELTPGAPKDERAAAAPTASPAAEAKPKAKKGGGGFKFGPEFREQPGETPEQKIARLQRLVEEAKRAAGKL